VLVVLLGWPARCAADSFSAAVDAIVAKGKKRGTLAGLRILELPRGKVIYSLNANRVFKPASNMKLVVSAAALDMLGPSFSYRTVLARRGNDLAIVGSGDPATGDPRLANQRAEPITAMFHRWADALRAAGITTIRGRLLFDDSIFESRRTHPNWNPAELDSWFAAPVGGLNFNDNCIDTAVKPAAKPGQPAVVTLTPRTDSVRLENHCRSGGKGRPLIRREPGKDVLVLTGRCPKPTTVAPVAVNDPGMLFAGAFRMSLVAAGIQIGRDVRRVRIRNADGSLPAEWKVIAEHSTGLGDVLARCNKTSQNLFAECLLKTLGYRHGSTAGGTGLATGSWTTGRVAIRAFLAKVGVSAQECVIDDGSGLSHDNRLSPTHLTEVLRFMHNHPHRDIYVRSLAESGKDGTIKKRMRDIAGRVHAKTGYVSGVRTLSGYVSGRGGTSWACFAILFNGITGSTKMYAGIQDDVVRQIARQLDGGPPAGR
jgi:D-alanyl-D-alanine carboxypeptidase/D-alanyl-D-alanine-endopeptidase (penicillin-binding protein 4)